MYYAKELMSCFELEFTYLQKIEIVSGLKHGLNKKDVKVYAQREWNHLQMREIRLALEHHISRREIKKYMHCDMPVEKMQKIRLALEKGEKVERDYMHQWIPLVFMSGVILLFFTLFPYIQEQPYLELKQDVVTLQCGDIFDPMEYIASYSTMQGQLVLPSTFSTNEPGNHVAVYTLRTQKGIVEKILYIEVK